MEHDMASLEFNPRGWRETFIDEKNNLLYYLKDFKVAINHIGATAYVAGRSNRNVDLLVTTTSLSDLQSVMVRLVSKKYKVIEQSHDGDFYLLVGPNKVQGYGVSVRLMVYASNIFNRYQAFITLLKEDNNRVLRYNDFRLELLETYGSDWQKYNQMKQNYINLMIDENYKFE